MQERRVDSEAELQRMGYTFYNGRQQQQGQQDQHQQANRCVDMKSLQF